MTAVLVTFLLSALLCGAYRRFARTRQILDTPNERSSHVQPTPHGGGIALLSAFSFGLLFAAGLYGAWDDAFVVLAVAALILMIVGVVDDFRGLSVRVRLITYGLVCLLVAAMIVQVRGTANVPNAGVIVLLAALVMLWSLNLYNFMDGIDGIAATQAALACCYAAFLTLTMGHDRYALFCLLLAAAHSGFLIWNFPPARLFMGDAGSVPTGFLLAALAILGALQGQLNPLCWLVLLAVFTTDASWTLVWRMSTGQAFARPHRLHAYQRLSRYWGSHLRVDMLLLLINVLWLFPLTSAVQAWPDIGFFLVILAYLPLFWGMVKIGRVA